VLVLAEHSLTLLQERIIKDNFPLSTLSELPTGNLSFYISLHFMVSLLVICSLNVHFLCAGVCVCFSFNSCSATLSLVAEVEEKPKFDVDKAALLVKELRKSFNSGKTKSYEWRMSQLKAIDKMIEEKEKDITEALSKDLSKPELEAFIAEVLNLFLCVYND
jgi:hypothetical protein